MGRRPVWVGLPFLVAVGAAVGLAALISHNGGARMHATQTAGIAKARSGALPPNVIGLRRTQVLCRLQASETRLIIDGYVESRDHEISESLCRGRASVQPDPTVLRQSPAPSSPLEAATRSAISRTLSISNAMKSILCGS